MWNHRVWRHTHHGADEEESFQVKETYHNKAGEICACTEDAAEAYGYTLEELKENLQRMLKATEQPALDEEGFVFAQWDLSDTDDEEEFNADNL